MTATDTMTTTAVTLDMMDMKGVLDRNGRSVYGPDVEKTAEISKDTAEIAPWLMPDEAVSLCSQFVVFGTVVGREKYVHAWLL